MKKSINLKACCPHCKSLLPYHPASLKPVYRTKGGEDVFQCGSCKGEFKIDLSELAALSYKIKSGNLEIPVLQGIRVENLLPSEKEALEKEENGFPAWVGIALFILVLVLVYRAVSGTF